MSQRESASLSDQISPPTDAEPPATASRRPPPPPTAPAAPSTLTPRARTGLVMTLILGSLCALPALSMDLYLPAVPEIQDQLTTTSARVHLTLAACLIGLAVGQLVIGPMSDQLGRRRPLLVGTFCYVLASGACAVAPTVEVLTGFRVLQGLAGAAGIVIARAIVRDLYEGLAMARFFSTLMLVSGIAPILAPVFGGQLLRVTDWRGLFVALAVLGLLMGLVVLRWLPETLPPGQRQSGGVGNALRTAGGLFRDRVFTGYLLVTSLTFGSLFAYVAASPNLVQVIHGGSPQLFSVIFMVNSAGMVALSQVNGRVLVGRVPLHRVMITGLLVIIAASVVLVLLTTGVFGDVGLLPICAALFVLMACMSLVMPNANTHGLMRAPHAAGAASALLGAAQFFVGALASPLVGIGGAHTAVPMAVVQLTFALSAMASLVVLCRPWRSGRELTP